MTYDWITPFQYEEFEFDGAYIVGSCDGYKLLLSRQGTIIILNDDLIASLFNKKPNIDLQIKLLQRFIASTADKPLEPNAPQLKPRYFIIDLTDNCNFDCCYCFRDLHKKRSISEESLELIIKYILSFCEKEHISRIGVQLWGGEPILELNKIGVICRKFQESPIKVSVDLETNASLITDDVAKELFELGVHVGVSIDGTQKLHNIQRRYASGDESFHDVVKGVENLRKYYHNNIGGITVVTKHNVDFASDILRYYIFELSLSGIKFNVVRDNRYAKEKQLVPSLEQVSMFYKQIFEDVVAYHRMGIRFIEAGMQTRLENLLYSSRKDCCVSQGCTGGQAIISIDQSGDIYPCEMTDFQEEKISTIKDEPNFLLGKISEKSSDSNYYRIKFKKDCKNCPWHFFCRGGCASRIQYQGSGTVDEFECVVNQTLYPLLSDLILREPNIAYSMINER